MHKTTISYALCNSKMEPVMHFSDMAQLENWVQRQIERHGSAPACVPCEITTTVETREIKNDESEGRTSGQVGTVVQQEPADPSDS